MNRSFFESPVCGIFGAIARWVLGGIFLYMGVSKALHPVEFLKILRQYEMFENSAVLNLIAGSLPWLEVFIGLLLVSGIAVRGAGLISFGMLVPFTLIVLYRAMLAHNTQGIPFCAIRFDCGCGAGEVVICHKLAENSLLILLSVFTFTARSGFGCLRFSITGNR